MHEDSLLKIPEVARRLSVSRTTVYEMIWRGELPIVRIGRSVRVCPADLERCIDRNRQQGHGDHEV